MDNSKDQVDLERNRKAMVLLENLFSKALDDLVEAAVSRIDREADTAALSKERIKATYWVWASNHVSKRLKESMTFLTKEDPRFVPLFVLGELTEKALRKQQEETVPIIVPGKKI